MNENQMAVEEVHTHFIVLIQMRTNKIMYVYMKLILD